MAAYSLSGFSFPQCPATAALVSKPTGTYVSVIIVDNMTADGESGNSKEQWK